MVSPCTSGAPSFADNEVTGPREGNGVCSTSLVVIVNTPNSSIVGRKSLACDEIGISSEDKIWRALEVITGVYGQVCRSGKRSSNNGGYNDEG